jgi:hypothetical protein
MANPTKSGMYVKTFKDILSQVAYTGGNINLTLATYKISAYSAAATDGAGTLDFSGAQAWASTNETVSTANWPTGGILLSVAAAGGTSTAPTLAEGTTTQVGAIVWDMNDVSVASTTFATGPWGVIIYADPVSVPVAKPMIIAVNFGQAYPTNNGTFGIQWSNTAGSVGVASFDITP